MKHRAEDGMLTRMFRRTSPAGFGNVDDHAVRSAVFHFGVDMRRQAFAQTECVVDVVPNRGAGSPQAPVRCFDAIHFEANVIDRKSTRLNSSHPSISYAVFCLKKKISKRFTT